jgi:thiol:disulfide interchange protein DsbC
MRHRSIFGVFMRFIPLLSALVFALIGSTAFADSKSVSASLKQKFPKLAFESVEPVTEQGVKGLYVIKINKRIAYTDETVSFVFTNGNLLSGSTAENLTTTHQQNSNKSLFSSLPKEKAFKTVFGKGQRQIITIEDADCPVCKDFTKSLHAFPNPERLNVTVYTFPFALERLHPDAARKGAAIWCSASSDSGRAAAWKSWMVDGKIPSSNKTCADPVRENITRFAQLGINATPSILFSDGSAVPGSLEPEQLIQALNALDKPVK